MTTEDRRGLGYAPGVTGKFLFRVRQRLLRDSYGPLIERGRLGAAKLDAVLRGVALYEEHLGNRAAPPGIVLDRYTYERLHDLARSPTHFRGRRGRRTLTDTEEVARKREWVRQQLHVLEAATLLHLGPSQRSHGRPQIVVLRDDGSGASFDDPGATAADNTDDHYLTILGGVIASGLLGRWDAQRLVAYLCATIAEQQDAAGRTVEVGSGRWWRSPRWFIDPAYRLPGAALMSFSETSIKRGLLALRRDGLIEARQIDRHPRTGTRLKGGRRNLYTNRFREGVGLADMVSVASFADKVTAELSDLASEG